jgi:drug/metabolite transporter (DMT)-like permease
VSALLALLASLLWGTSDFLGGTVSRRVAVARVLLVSQLVALAGLVPLALLTGEVGADRGYLLPAAAAGAVGVVALGAFYQALATGTMGVVAPVAALGVVVPVVVGLLSGESPGPVQLLGITVAVLGVVLASGPEVRGGSGGRPLLLAVLAAVGFGLVLVLVAAAADSSVVMTLLTMRAVGAVLLTAALRLRPPEGGRLRAQPPGLLATIAALGVGDVVSNGSFALATTRPGALVSITGVLASLYPVVTVLLARQVHGERLRGVQVVGVVAALGGVVLIAGG